jgi:hypothetical protein
MDLLAIAKNAAYRVEAVSIANKVPVAVWSSTFTETSWIRRQRILCSSK